MSKATPKLPSTDEKRNSVRELADELHNRVLEASALVTALATIAATTTVTTESLTRLRHMLVSAQAATLAVVELSTELHAAVRQ